MTQFLLIEALCVDARRTTQRATDCIAHCFARTLHERQRIAVWRALRGRWQLPMDVSIMKEVEAALFSPLRGNIAIPEEIPYRVMRRTVRADLTRSYRTLATRMDYLARLNHERAITEILLRHFQDELSGVSRLCRNLECQLGLVLDTAPWTVGIFTAQPIGLLATGQ